MELALPRTKSAAADDKEIPERGAVGFGVAGTIAAGGLAGVAFVKVGRADVFGLVGFVRTSKANTPTPFASRACTPSARVTVIGAESTCKGVARASGPLASPFACEERWEASALSPHRSCDGSGAQRWPSARPARIGPGGPLPRYGAGLTVAPRLLTSSAPRGIGPNN